jgi:hypothetical protein
MHLDIEIFAEHRIVTECHHDACEEHSSSAGHSAGFPTCESLKVCPASRADALGDRGSLKRSLRVCKASRATALHVIGSVMQNALFWCTLELSL